MQTNQSPQITSAMLMAAGTGTRLRPFTLDCSKSVLPVMGIPVAQFTMDTLALAGVTQMIMNVHHHATQTARTLRSLDTGSAHLTLSDESDQLLGSAGGITKALKHLDPGPFFLANTDTICDVDWQALARAHFGLRAKHKITMTLALTTLTAQTERYRQITLDPNTRLIKSLGEPTLNQPFFIGAAVIEPEAFIGLPEGPSDFVAQVLNPALEKHQAAGFMNSGLWLDMGSPKAWLETHITLLKLLESSGLTTANGSAWKKRLEANNRRVSDSIWVSQRHLQRRFSTADWSPPAYWDGKRAPTQFGPRAVLYGDPADSSDLNLSHGIGYGAHWVSDDPISTSET